MVRSISKIKLSETSIRYFIRLFDEDSSGSHITRRQLPFLKEVVVEGEINHMLYTGPALFEKLTMCHNGERWMIELEGVVEDG